MSLQHRPAGGHGHHLRPPAGVRAAECCRYPAVVKLPVIVIKSIMHVLCNGQAEIRLAPRRRHAHLHDADLYACAGPPDLTRTDVQPNFSCPHRISTDTVLGGKAACSGRLHARNRQQAALQQPQNHRHSAAGPDCGQMWHRLGHRLAWQGIMAVAPSHDDSQSVHSMLIYRLTT